MAKFQTDRQQSEELAEQLTLPRPDSRLRVGIGADVTFYHVPDGLKPVYGSSPKSFHVFVRIRPGKMRH